MMCHCRFVTCDQCSTLVGDVEGGGPRLSGGTEYMGNLYLLLNFAVNLKLLLKKSLKIFCTLNPKLNKPLLRFEFQLISALLPKILACLL